MNETVIVAIICGLISGLAGTVASIFWAAYSEAQKRQIEFLQSQLRELYGPLHFFCVQNVELVKLQGRIAEAYKSEFCQNAVGSAEDRQARRVEAFTTIDVENAYGAKVRENNKRMARVIEDKWSFIDEDDREALAELIVHHIRIDTETTEKGMTKLPLGMTQEIGSILIYDSKFTSRIDRKWAAKQAELQRKLKVTCFWTKSKSTA